MTNTAELHRLSDRAKPAAASDRNRHEPRLAPRALSQALTALAALLWLPAALHAEPPYVAREADRVVIGTASSRAVFERQPRGCFVMLIEARQDAAWRPVLDGRKPLIQGTSFGLEPTRVIDSSVTDTSAVVRLGGHHGDPGFDWDIAVTADAALPLHFRVALKLTQQVILSGLEPQAALWMAHPAADAVRVDQGPGNIYHGTPEAQWGNSFPAAYLWTGGSEVALLFNPGPMDWMGPRSLFRFHDCRVQSWDEDGTTAIGLRVVKRNFHELGPGQVVLDWWLHAAAGVARPRTRIEALDRLVRRLEPLHPATAPPLTDRLTGRPGTWTDLASGVTAALMRRGVVYEDLELPADEPWRDGPAFQEHVISTLRVSTDYAVGSPCDPAQARPNVLAGWDFSTCNNYLSAFLASERADPDPMRREFLAGKVHALPLFYDPRAGLLRHGTRHPLHVGDREMAWQNLMFAVEAARVHRFMRSEDFDPAVGGRLLMSLRSTMDLVRRCGDVLPQWFDPYERRALAQGDLPELGVVYEPWQLGTYAWLMSEAYSISGDALYRDEAARALNRLLGGDLRIAVTNTRYSATYADPVDFPITEIFGNAWGMAAAIRLADGAADAEHWLQVSDTFLNSLARMTYWYESSTVGDTRDQAVRQAGLFRNHGGAMTGSPWENAEATLAMVVRLRLDGEPRPLLLKLLNLQRINAMTYFPRCLPADAQPCPSVTAHVAAALPIEDAYTLEHGGRHGAAGLAAYMSGIAMWYALLFERWATTDDPAALVVCLDVPLGLDGALATEQRNVLVYNPSDEAKRLRVRVLGLAPATYRTTVRQVADAAAERRASAADLAAGLELALAAGGWARIEVTDPAEAVGERTALQARARDALAVAYRVLQESATAASPATLAAAKAEFAAAVTALHGGQWAEALAGATHAKAVMR